MKHRYEGADVAREEISMVELGRLGRLGRWAADHLRLVAIVWLGVLVGLGVLAPRVENALSGAGWKALGSESVEARQLIDRHFGGLGAYSLAVVVDARSRTIDDAAFRSTVRRVSSTLERDPATGAVVSPRGN